MKYFTRSISASVVTHISVDFYVFSNLTLRFIFQNRVTYGPQHEKSISSNQLSNNCYKQNVSDFCEEIPCRVGDELLKQSPIARIQS